MHPDAITADAVHQALRAMRSSRSLASSSPLIHLVAVTQSLRAERLADAPAARSSQLQALLDALVGESLAALRGDPAPTSPSRPSADDALARLRADFQAGSVDREAWAALWFQYLSGTSATLRDAADVLGLGYNTVRRRLERGYELLAAALRDRERTAADSVARGRGVPRPLTRFVGRDAEIAAIRAVMAEHRLVTLTGPGGIGKSRLAIRLAEDLAADYPDGAVFVEMVALGHDRQVPQAVMIALGLQEAPGLDHTDVIVRCVAEKRLLLVLDNCEHLVAACSTLVGELLRRSPALQILATSREELHVDGAMRWPVPPLALPPDVLGADAGALMHYDATRLFGARAAVAMPGFTISDADAARTARICRRLEGIPLAIELAAARLRQLSLDQLDARLADRFPVLSDGRHVSRPDHAALRRTLEWSFELLAPPERQVLMRLSVFRGGWTIEAAEAVCQGDGIDESAVLDLLAALEAKSMVAPRGTNAVRRFGMLETVREYAHEQLAATGDIASWRTRHLMYVTESAERAQPGLRDTDPAPSLAFHDAERANVNAALEWAIACPSFEAGCRLVDAAYPFWDIRGEWGMALRIVRALLAADDPPSVGKHRARLLKHATALAYDLCEYTEARRFADEGLALSRQLDWPAMAGSYLQSLAVITEADCDWPAARLLYDAAIAAAREAGDHVLEAKVLYNQGVTANFLGDYAEAARLTEQSLALDRAAGDPHSIAETLGGLGNIYWSLGDRSRARATYQESLDILRPLNARPVLAVALCRLGNVALEDGDLQVADDLLSESLSLSREVGDLRTAVPILNLLGRACVRRGAHEAAHAKYDEALAIGLSLDAPELVAASLQVMAALAVAEREPLRALRLFGRAAEEWRAAGVAAPFSTPGEVLDALNSAKGEVGDHAARAALAEGAELTSRELAGYARRQVPWSEVAGAVAARRPADPSHGSVAL